MGQLPSLNSSDELIPELIYSQYENRERRGGNERIGASELGKPCDRAIWFGFRWASAKIFGGRLLRLFNTGHREEERVIEDLRSIGCRVLDKDPETNKQFKVEAGRMVTKPDGIVYNVPGAEKTPCALEIKTHNDKSFNALKKDRVQKAKPEHYIQAQLEMHWMKLTRCLYMAINKNSDEIYSERLYYDKQFAEAIVARAERIAGMASPPEKIHKDPSFYLCKFCDHRDVCHNSKVAQVNCRTCVNSTPRADGSWFCEKFDVVLDYNAQQEGCNSHLFIPNLIGNSTAIDAAEDGSWIKYSSNGEEWVQGEGGISSGEMLEMDKE